MAECRVRKNDRQYGRGARERGSAAKPKRFRCHHAEARQHIHGQLWAAEALMCRLRLVQQV
jgi:hypothetical protein